jgi:site-specific DNA-cytosine methylase
MTSQINPNNVDGTYPVAGQPNNTQGFRDNFTNIKTNFSYAETEITDLQNNGIFKAALAGTTLNNNMADNLIYAVKLQDVSYTFLQNAATSGSIAIDYSAGQYQYISTTGSISLNFSNFPVIGAGIMQTVIHALNERGYGIAWRSFNSQHFGIAQRRKRVFIVGFFGDGGERAAEVLAIEEGRRRFIGTGGKEESKPTVGSPKRTANDLIHTFSKARRAQSVEDYETWVERDFTNTLNAFDNATEVRATELVVSQGRVRRLMPIEMERLQGFPDNWTDGQADSNRYKQMGNAVSVPVAQWIAERMIANA